MMIRSVAFTKEAYIGREVRIAARVSKDTTKTWSAKIYLFIRNGYGALTLQRGPQRESIDDAISDASDLLSEISKEVRKLSATIAKEVKEKHKDEDEDEDEGNTPVSVPEGDTE